MEHSFLSFQVDYWDGPWQNRQAFLSALCSARPVLFISPPHHVRDLSFRGIRKRTKLKGLVRVRRDLWSWVPPLYLPTNHRYPVIERLLKAARVRLVRRVAGRIGVREPASIVWHPSVMSNWADATTRPLIYYKYDHYAGYGGIAATERRFFDERERALFHEADFVFVTSQGLYDLHACDAPGRIHLLPHGVDFEAFSVPENVVASQPEDISVVPTPRVGYVGVVNEKVDFKLVGSLARHRRDIAFVIIGPNRCRTDDGNRAFSHLRAEPNVHYLGSKSHDAVPAYLHSLDVGMMCYALTEWVKLGYPLKLHEYLAAGLPAVASPLPELSPFGEVVTIADSVASWLDGIDSALDDSLDPIRRQQRIRVARANSWRSRVDRFLQIVDRYE